MSDKQIVLDAVQRMPESATIEEIRETVALLAAIRRGEVAANAGAVIPHEEVKRRSAVWTTQ